MQNYDPHFIFQELGRYNFKINAIPKTIEKYMTFCIEQAKESTNDCWFSLVFIGSVHFLNQILDNLVKNLREND